LLPPGTPGSETREHRDPRHGQKEALTIRTDGKATTAKTIVRRIVQGTNVTNQRLVFEKK